jgi:hypothetical protein
MENLRQNLQIKVKKKKELLRNHLGVVKEVNLKELSEVEGIISGNSTFEGIISGNSTFEMNE